MAQNSNPSRVVGITSFFVMLFGLLFGVLLILGIWMLFNEEQGELFGISFAAVFVLFFLSVATHNALRGYYGLPKL